MTRASALTRKAADPSVRSEARVLADTMEEYRACFPSTTSTDADRLPGRALSMLGQLCREHGFRRNTVDRHVQSTSVRCECGLGVIRECLLERFHLCVGDRLQPVARPA